MLVTPELQANLAAEEKSCSVSFKGLVLQGRSCALEIWKYSGASICWIKVGTVALYNSAGSTETVTTWSGSSDTH